jgi:cyclase
MLKSRLIPCIITKGELVVQSFNFQRYLPIGNVKTAIEFFVNWDVDEIIVIDIDATVEGRSPNVALVEWAARECFVPLTVGGGITGLADIQHLLNAGADKVCLNNIVKVAPDFVTKAASVYGSQCITVSIDAVETDQGLCVFDYATGKADQGLLVKDYAQKVEALGAGEIFLNSVDRDGSRLGYDLTLLETVSSSVSIPVIACGGVGKFEHLSQAILNGGCQAAAAANIFQHTEHSTIAAKSQLLKDGVSVRLSSNVKYNDFKFDCDGRPY